MWQVLYHCGACPRCGGAFREDLRRSKYDAYPICVTCGFMQYDSIIDLEVAKAEAEQDEGMGGSRLDRALTKYTDYERIKARRRTEKRQRYSLKQYG